MPLDLALGIWSSSPHIVSMFHLPNLLSVVRLLLVPVLLTLAWHGHPRIFLGGLIASLTSDAADGFLARRLNQTSDLGAKLDSWADFITYLALPFCGWWLRPEVVREERLSLGVGIFFYLAATVAGFAKFQRLTSYHTWAAKVSAWLVGAAVLVFFAGGPGWWFRIVMPFVALTNLEEIAITATLPIPMANVPSLWHALHLRRTQKGPIAPAPASQLARPPSRQPTRSA